jgi:hypothetical protein
MGDGVLSVSFLWNVGDGGLSCSGGVNVFVAVRIGKFILLHMA